uniref:Cyclin_C domain-containing protein n=1 Tax=Steinernema glaseri TaxID=37863 RepID=A0A1I8AVP7_9BILA
MSPAICTFWRATWSQTRRELWESLNLGKILLLAERFWPIGNEPTFLRIVFSAATLYSLFKDVASEEVICKCYELASEALLIGDMSLTPSEWKESLTYCENIESAFMLRRRVEPTEPSEQEVDPEEDDLYHQVEGEEELYGKLFVAATTSTILFEAHQLEEEMFVDSFVRETIREAMLECCAKVAAATKIADDATVFALGDAVSERFQFTSDYFYGEKESSRRESIVPEFDGHMYEDGPLAGASMSAEEAPKDLENEAAAKEDISHEIYDAKTDFERRFGKGRRRGARTASTDMPVIVVKPQNFVAEFRRQPLLNFHAIPQPRNFAVPMVPAEPRPIPKIHIESVDDSPSSDSEEFSC